MDLQLDKFNIDNEEILPMVLGSSLIFSHPPYHNIVKCFRSPIAFGSDSMDLQLNKSNINNEEMFPKV